MNSQSATLSLAEATSDDAVELNVAVIYENLAAGHRALAFIAIHALNSDYAWTLLGRLQELPA